MCSAIFPWGIHIWSFKTLACTAHKIWHASKTNTDPDGPTDNLKPICPLNFFDYKSAIPGNHLKYSMLALTVLSTDVWTDVDDLPEVLPPDFPPCGRRGPGRLLLGERPGLLCLLAERRKRKRLSKLPKSGESNKPLPSDMVIFSHIQPCFNFSPPVSIPSASKEHLWLWRKVSLNDKYDRMRNRIQFYLIVHVYHYVSMDKSINFRNFFFVVWPMFRLAWPSDMHFEKKLLSLTANCMVYFYMYGS